MRAELIDEFFSACRHQFSWPRRADNGDYYQMCVHCGSKYLYDWNKMRRTARLRQEDSAPDSGRLITRQCGKKPAWIPRERRLRHRVPLLFRASGTSGWIAAVTENISRSGLLFRSATALEIGTGVEMTLEMPKELLGEASQVVCNGLIVRVEPAHTTTRKEKHMFLMACSINSCELAMPQAAETGTGR